ncbi:MAG: hypothetical protein ABIJ92_02840 [Candidatus Aenigmatarchaeota archaeon]
MDTSMVFALIFAVIVIALFLVVGLGQITNLTCLGSNAQIIKAITDIEILVDDTVLQAEDSSNVFQLRIPSDSEFCFINPIALDDPAFAGPGWDPATLDPVHRALIEDPQNRYNIWYKKCPNAYDGYMISDLSQRMNFCTKSRKLYIENVDGFSVSIEPVLNST